MRKGNAVRMTKDALENYGCKDVVLIITHVATKYMPAKQFFNLGSPDGYHPGFDESSGSKLYDLETEDGKAWPNSLYGWELRYTRRTK